MLDWNNRDSLKEFAKNMARAVRDKEGRVKRLFSELSICTSPYEAKMVIAFHINRLGRHPLVKPLREILISIPTNIKEFRYNFLPNIRFLYIFIMYYKKFDG